jgi:hypothetical protein
MVYVKNLNTRRTSRKLDGKLEGSLKVSTVLSPAAIKLELSSRCCIHNAFHVHSSNSIDSPKIALDVHQHFLTKHMSFVIKRVVMSTKQDLKLKISLAASITRNGNRFYIWSSGKGIRKKQIGLRNLMRSSTTRDC